MILIEKDGFHLNPNTKFVEKLTKRIENNDGECPCHNESVDKHCPCTDFREKGECHCQLYLRD